MHEAKPLHEHEIKTETKSEFEPVMRLEPLEIRLQELQVKTKC